MTEAEWLTSADPPTMLKFRVGKTSARKLRLFGCACCRQVWDLLAEDCFRTAVEVAERFCDETASKKELAAAKKVIGAALERIGLVGTSQPIQRAIGCAWSATRNPKTAAVYPLWVLTDDADRMWQVQYLRDIFGNPFRPLPPRPEAIAPLAEQIYTGAWEKMQLLGEWLQEHGYWSEGEHCLDPNNHHVKGCWVVDWITGRE